MAQPKHGNPAYRLLAQRPLPAATLTVVALMLSGLPVTAFAGNCDATGKLKFLGATADSAHSVWLSATSAGAFKLDAAQGNQTVDSWNRGRRGLRVSISPVVSNGNGGTHKLYEDGGNKDCLLDTQNQQGGIIFPPTRPQRPPIPLTPQVPSKPPEGVTPPVAVVPSLPGGVTPPIGTLPPTGVTPSLHGGIVPPCAAFPSL